jgi:hypothetical protein
VHVGEESVRRLLELDANLGLALVQGLATLHTRPTPRTSHVTHPRTHTRTHKPEAGRSPATTAPSHAHRPSG